MSEQTLVQRAIQRLHDGIARRETTLDLEAIKAVLVEMGTQKARAERLEKERDEARFEAAGNRARAENLYTDWRKLLDDKAVIEADLRRVSAALEAVRKDMNHYQDRCIAYQIEARKQKG